MSPWARLLHFFMRNFGRKTITLLASQDCCKKRSVKKDALLARKPEKHSLFLGSEACTGGTSTKGSGKGHRMDGSWPPPPSASREGLPPRPRRRASGSGSVSRPSPVAHSGLGQRDKQGWPASGRGCLGSRRLLYPGALCSSRRPSPHCSSRKTCSRSIIDTSSWRCPVLERGR